jgi:hypothetical protein
VTSLLGVSSQQRPPAETRYECVYWLLHRIPKAALTGGQSVFDADEYGRATALVSDGELRRMLRESPDETRRHLVAANPHLWDVIRRQQQARANGPNAGAEAEAQP